MEQETIEEKGRVRGNSQLQLITPRQPEKKKFYYQKRHLSQNYQIDLAENQTQQSMHLPSLR